MKNTLKILLFLYSFSMSVVLAQQDESQATRDAVKNRYPLVQKPYLELALGSIKARGWLKEQLIRQKDGMTGQLDELYPLVMGERNGWLGGDGDQWERGPYWIDGLLPLAYILDDEELKAKVKPWVEWSLNNQREDGYFGPKVVAVPYDYEEGVQRDNIEDWWPKMVMLKVLQQHYSATGDKRVIDLMTNYFKFQLENLPSTPLGHWTFWGNRRGGDNLMMVHWLYNITGDEFLLELGELIHQQTFDWKSIFTEQDHLSRKGSLHCVNVAQGIKEPIVYYQQSKDSRYIDAVDEGFQKLMKYNGQPHGLYGGDEWLHGTDPTQGSEFCSAVEMMYSLETMLTITGKLDFAERLERIAFNALPTQATDNYMERQYFQQNNQVAITRTARNFINPNEGTSGCFGLLTGYPCCTANMHQGWPKFTQNLWYKTANDGIAAIVYAPSEVTTTVSEGTTVTWVEETNYPFEESIHFELTECSQINAAFPFHLRIPAWCKDATVLVNGKKFDTARGGKELIIKRDWNKGDKVELKLPMEISTSTWHENAQVVERGRLVYALKVEEKWEKVDFKSESTRYGDYYYEVKPKSAWNYGILKEGDKPVTQHMKVVKGKKVAEYPWNMENAPISIKVKAKKIPYWEMYNDAAGPLMFSPVPDVKTEVEEVTLIPYGCTTLRITEFPTVY